MFRPIRAHILALSTNQNENQNHVSWFGARFSRAWHQLHVSVESSDWSNVLSTFDATYQLRFL